MAVVTLETLIQQYGESEAIFQSEQTMESYDAFMAYKAQLFEMYQDILSCFCGYVGHLNKCAGRVNEGKVPKPKYINFLSERTLFLKDQLLQVKEVLGYTDGLSFMGDNKYFFGEIKDGLLYGIDGKPVDKDAVETFSLQWLDNHTMEDNNYCYENAVFLYFMSHPESLKLEKPSFIKKIGRRFLLWKNQNLKSCA